MNKPEGGTQLHSACRNLRCKEMYYQGAQTEEDEFHSGVYWCGQTQEGFGPDGQPATKSACCAGRSCHVG